MDDYNLIHELRVLAIAEQFRPLDDDARDSYIQIATVNTLREAANRLEFFVQEDKQHKIDEILAKRK